MVKVRLQTKLLLFLVLTITALTCTTLLIVQYRLRARARQDIYEALNNSVVTFQNFERQRQITLARAAGLLADIPYLKAIMTTQHEATIQDASLEYWRTVGSDLFVLADRTGKVVALHTSTAGFDRATAQTSFERTLAHAQNRDWWFGGGHLYEVFLQPIYFGAPSDNSLLGELAIGYEIDDRVAGEVSRIASGEVAFRYGKTVVVSTLSANSQKQFATMGTPLLDSATTSAQDVQLGDERFLGTSVELAPGGGTKVSLTVLKSYDKATGFLQSLNRLLLGLGFAAVLAGSGLVFLISHTFTRPLANLVSGVHALEKRDFAFPLEPHSNDEVAELTTAFDRMRRSLQKSQEELLHADRLATIGRMASMISHDLRHPLTAILAYAEFLAEGDMDDAQRQDLFQEIRLAVSRMTDLIASLLEFSKAQEGLRPVRGNVVETVDRALQTMRLRPEFRHIRITHTHEGLLEGSFDSKKLERVIHNLVLNACEAVPADSGKIEVTTIRTEDGVEIRVADNGPGIPESIRDTVFHPFVSSGKETGTGLGLAVALKAVQDHGGDIRIESTGERGTVFRLSIPLTSAPQTSRTA